MSFNRATKIRTGLNWWQLRQLRGQVSFLQNFKCWGCDNPLIPTNGYSHLHHLNGKPKDNRIINLAVCCQVCHFDSHSFRGSKDRGFIPKKKRISKKEAIRQRIIPLKNLQISKTQEILSSNIIV